MSGWRPVALVALVAAATVAGCTSATSHHPASGQNSATTLGSAATGQTASTGTGPTASAGTSVRASTKPTAPTPSGPARLIVSPAGDATNISPATPVVVGVARGQLASVSLVNGSGKKVAGTLAADKTSWRLAEPLGYGKKYTLTARAVSADGKAVQKTSSFTTLTPNQQTTPFFDTTGGLALTDGATYGVGLVVNLHWDLPITDRKAAEKTLSVHTTPAVAGSWYWVDDQDLHWRPQHYYASGTTVTVTANDYGRKLGQGLYGADTRSIHFTIGASQVSIADDKTHQVKVYVNGVLKRTMPTSMGRGGAQVIKGRTITYWTPRGTYTVIGHANPVLMDSTTYGLPLNQGGYREYIYYATRISTGGIYLHQMASTVWAQGHRDVSHGCLNLSPANAKWFYSFSHVGDVVTVEHTGGAPLQVWQNGDWSLPWAQWRQGSALT